MMNTKLWVMIFVMGLSGYAGAKDGSFNNVENALRKISETALKNVAVAVDDADKEVLTPLEPPADPEHDGFKSCEKYAGYDYVINELKVGLRPGGHASVHCPEVLTLHKKLKEHCSTKTYLKSDSSFKKFFPDGSFNDESKLKGYVECQILTAFSVENDSPRIEQILERKNSADGRMTCRGPKTYTMDFRSCEKALSYYNAVIIAEQGMELQQKVRTDLHNSNSQKNTNAALARGESQTAVYDAAIDSSNHSKSMETEKMLAYSGAVSALSYAYSMIKSEGDIREDCEAHFKKFMEQKSQASAECRRVISKFKRNIVANQEVKASFATAITTFIAKGVQAGIARDQFGKKADIIGKAKEGPKYNDDPDMLLELCEFNPADPACVKRGNRVAGSRESTNGTLSFDADDGVNSFNLNPASETFGEAGSETNLPDDKNNVASINSPFKDAAQEAKGILNPADQAVVQATGGAGGGGGGGGGAGGGGGGSASLGGDLKGAQKETSGDPQVKTGKVSGTYSASGGGGYKGVGKSKEDSGNPFSSLFDQKGSEGGVEEDRTIASGDIDGKTSGLFEKISSRYSKIKADKRIEAQNLE